MNYFPNIRNPAINLVGLKNDFCNTYLQNYLTLVAYLIYLVKPDNEPIQFYISQMRVLLLVVCLICSFSLRIKVHLQHQEVIPDKATANNQKDSKDTEDDDSTFPTTNVKGKYKKAQNNKEKTDLSVFPFQLSQQGLPGGWTGRKVTSRDNLDQNEKELWDFTVRSDPQILDETLVSVMSQIVAGTNTCFNVIESGTDKLVSYCVWSQPWNNNFMRLTNPYGNQFQQGGYQ